ncbi:hypothetical protein TNCT_472531 [Trichonephila clavata]|uniref:Uncharacterized protein n=1 Tax=Trichonephila clavata TaxID=2740835 RepID=A0A8X6IUP5_TRICU|nr:hypothetical protein TNCT_472531 [Trichonephila clavata]
MLTSKTRVSRVKNSVSTSTRALFCLTSRQFVTCYPSNSNNANLRDLCVSDYKITLAWLKSEPRRWQPFVANPVAQIQELTPNVTGTL